MPVLWRAPLVQGRQTLALLNVHRVVGRMILYVLKNSRDASYYRMTVGIGPLMTSSLDMAAKLEQKEAVRILGQHWSLGECGIVPLSQEVERAKAASLSSRGVSVVTPPKRVR